MKISGIKVVLSEEDILSIIQDYVQIEGLKIDSIEIKESIVIKGSYKKKITIPFIVKVGLGNIHGNIVNVKLFSIKICRISVFKAIKNFVLKKLLADFLEYGITVYKETVEIDLEKASKLVPYFYFKLKTIKMIEGALEVEAEDVVYSERKPVADLQKRDKALHEFEIEDGYSKIRDKLLDKMPDKCDKIALYAMILPDIIALLWRLFKDKRVKIQVKLKVAGVIAYLMSPLDIISDTIPFIGKIDDVAIAFFALNAILNEVPKEIILQNWQGKEDIILLAREAVEYISGLVGSKNVGKLIFAVKYIFKKSEENPNCKKEFTT